MAKYPDLPSCLTCADTLERLYEDALDAKHEWIIAMLEMGQEIPLPKKTTC